MHTPENDTMERVPVLRDAIRDYEDVSPPPDLMPNILSRIQPKQPSVWQRMLRVLRQPITLSFRPATGLCALALAAVAVVSVNMVLRDAGAPVVPGTSILYSAKATPASLREYAGVPVRFVLADGQRRMRSVAVIGTFNQWQEGSFAMRYDDGMKAWVLEAVLPRGEHEYVFLVDGHMTIPDPGVSLFREDSFGSRNSVLYIGEATHEI